MMRENNALTLEPGGLRQRAAAGIRAATEGSILAAARTVELAVVCGTWLLLPVWPVLAAVIAGDDDYFRHYWTTLVRVEKHIRALWRGHSFFRMVAHRLSPPVLRVREDIVGSCTHCGRCCLDRACVFLAFDDSGRSRCRIYGRRLWKLFTNCGQYPIDGQEIALYRCPSFNAVRDPEASLRRIIPIAPAMQPAALETISAKSSETPEGLGA
jgi:hypothetical protein